MSTSQQKAGGNVSHTNVATPDAYAWLNPYGGAWSTPGNWTDVTAGGTARIAPGALNAVGITGGVGLGNSINITGTGAAASLAIAQNVLLWGTVAVGGAVVLAAAADLELDGGARLSAGAIDPGSAIEGSAAASLEVGNGSALAVTGAVDLASGSLLVAASGGVMQLGGLVAAVGSTILVDPSAAIEVGAAGGAALGAITIDKGEFVAVSGTIDGNVVVAGTLGVQAGGSLAIDPNDPFGSGQTIGGAGTLVLSQNSFLSLGVAGHAAVQFNGPNGQLALAGAQTGAIMGFMSGDVIETHLGFATGVSYRQASGSIATLTLTKAGAVVDTLTLVGNYTGDLFHMSFDAAGDGFVTLQTIGSAPTHPAVITGTPGADDLYATANYQTLTGLGGGDVLDARGFADIHFKDTSADLNGSTIDHFATGDVIDLTNVTSSAASAVFVPAHVDAQSSEYIPDTLTATDGAHTAVLIFGPSPLPVGYFSVGSDGAAGTDLRFVLVPTVATANNQTLTSHGVAATLDSGGFTGIDFKDSSADLNGITLENFGTTDIIDLTDLTPSEVSSSSYMPSQGGGKPGILTVLAGTRSVTVSITGTLAPGYFAASSDGSGGTDLRYIVVNIDPLTFNARLGGSYTATGNWHDTATNAAATAAPSQGNAVTIMQLGAGYTDVTGNGAAASLTTSGDVLLWGSIVVGSLTGTASGTLQQSGTLALDGGANVSFGSTVTVMGAVEVGGGSRLTGEQIAFAVSGSGLQAIGGSTVLFGSVASYGTMTITVDATSAVEIGAAGQAAKGALTVDAGATAALSGAIDGNVVVNGALVAHDLTIAGFGGAASAVGGSGMLEIAQGATLTLSGADAAAIAFFGAPAYGDDDMLFLNGALPTGAISGFGINDAITVAQTVTSVSYSQTTGSAGTLTLLDGGNAVGTLTLAGSYSAPQFQVLTAPGGQSSTITYSHAPGTTAGSPVSSNSDTYFWNNGQGGAWGNASNWTDNGNVPSTVPGADNPVVIQNSEPSGSPQIISGSASAASLDVAANTDFTGDITVGGSFDAGGSVFVNVGAAVTAGSLSVETLLDVAGGVVMIDSAFGGTASILGSLIVTGGGGVRVADQLGNSVINGTIAVDGLSHLEFGTAGSAAGGALTVDSGQVVYVGTDTGGYLAAFSGAIFGDIVLNGELAVDATGVGAAVFGGNASLGGFAGGIGSISGSGTISVSGSDLRLCDADSAAIALSTYTGTLSGPIYPLLELAGPLPTGTISGFAALESIRIDQTVTGLSFVQTTAGGGTLSLTDGAAVVGTLTLAGNYLGELFQLTLQSRSATALVAAISVQMAPGAAGSASASSNHDAYKWIGASGGTWSTAANWQDTTGNISPVTVAGSGNVVSIAGSTVANGYTTIGGNGAAASVAITGTVLITGSIAVAGQLGLSALGTTPASLALDSGARLTAASAMLGGTLEVGDASSVTVAGTATLQGGALEALDGSSVQVGGLVADGPDSIIVIDSNALIRIGDPNTAMLGALTQQTDTTAALTGAIYGSVIANGTLAVAAGGTLCIDMAGTAESSPYGNSTIGGVGVLSLSEGSTLALGVPSGAAITFAGPDAMLQVAALPTSIITGFASGDVITIDRTVTALSYAQTTGATATLTLSNGAATVGSLKLAGNFSALSFHLDSAANGNSATITLQSIGVAAEQPTLIQGTAAADLLQATADNQTLTGLGGGDTLSGSTFTGIDFKDLTGNLSGGTIQNFATSDVIDFTDMNSARASVTYVNGVLTAHDASHGATLSLGFLSTPASGSFAFASDGAGGTKVFWH